MVFRTRSGRWAKRSSRSQRGFTILEMIVVATMIGILATIALPALRDLPRRASEATLRTDLRTMRDVIDQYHGDKGYYPVALEDLVEDGYLRRIPVDPMTKSADTWILILEELDPEQPRAESSRPQDEEPGIIDVISGSDRISLDGEPYATW